MEFSKKSKAKGMSFFAFLFSISVYISIFNLSASTLLNNTKFWFLVSNTLILIIAADYGAFSASKQDLYDDYLMQAEATRSSSSSFVAQYMQENKQERQVVPKKEADDQLCQEKRVVHVVEPLGKNGNSDETKIKIRPRSAFRRSASLKAKRVVIDESKNKSIIKRSESGNGEVVNEFSAMSDEELNRRVEEFIERTNRQIRLQARGSLETSIEV
ncbi:hypothetical protein UlMin_018957 [Ulmus minor]